MPKNEVNKKLIERVSKSEKLMYVAKFLGKYKDIYCGKNKNGYVFDRGEKYDITTGNNISKALTYRYCLTESLYLFLFVSIKIND